MLGCGLRISHEIPGNQLTCCESHGYRYFGCGRRRKHCVHRGIHGDEKGSLAHKWSCGRVTCIFNSIPLPPSCILWELHQCSPVHLSSKSSSDISSLRNPGRYKPGFQMDLDAEGYEVFGRTFDIHGGWYSAENTNCGGNFIKFCWVPGSTGGTEIAVADCFYSQKSAMKLRTEPSSLKSQSRSANTNPLPLMRLSIIIISWLWTGQSMNREDQTFGQVRSLRYSWLET